MAPGRIVLAQLAESYSQGRFVESEKSCRDTDHEEKWTIFWLQNRNNFEKRVAWDSGRFLSPDFVRRSDGFIYQRRRSIWEDLWVFQNVPLSWWTTHLFIMFFFLGSTEIYSTDLIRVAWL
ncbi:uncharacterized protein CDAR_237851 [Caerostris darwini]|uniref:Uncharacterized protein n=1 Tax=Caerostris darwini TaxID=1538125 RepID=A0AAV4S148_9ARAC|nr:uncharacterized protein CDAR_237851 [Caerostris darwini]